MESEQTNDALRVYARLLRAGRSVQARWERTLAEQRLTARQFAVLEALLKTGPGAQRDLASHLPTGTANLTDVLDKLVARDLLTRDRYSRARRLMMLPLTRKGRDL